MKVALAQLNPTIGDFAGNVAMALRAYERARVRGADWVAFSELFLCGYPPKDLLEQPAFIDANLAALGEFAASTGPVPAIIGFVARRSDPGQGRTLSNAAAVCSSGQVRSIHRKWLLPTYDVFDELRYFEPATSLELAHLDGCNLGVTICEDAWNDPDLFPHPLYREDPVALTVRQGADVLLNISASPFTVDKRNFRPRMLASHAKKHHRPLLFVNQVGGQDDLVFDGHSMAFDAKGQVIACGKEFEEDLILVDLDSRSGDVHAPEPSDVAAAYAALVLGTRDYARRCGFRSAIVGLSGGIDSSLVACIAVDALGKENVWGVSMPSRFSSEGSLTDARALAEQLGTRYEVISIEPPFSGFLESLGRFLQEPAGATQENIQARVRGTILMALSNQFGHLVLSTGNKSELAMGYCTLYGDMAGGLDVLSDVPKTMVYQLARHANERAGRAVIGENVFRKPPSAELRPNQTDQDSLPPYEVLDPLIERHIEGHAGRKELLAQGFASELVSDFLGRVRASEYKRRQMAPGLKILSKSFGPGRRMPIAHAWKG